MPDAENKMPLWPGPRVLVPMAADILLVGKPDSANTVYASTATSYLDLYMNPGSVNPLPFVKASPNPKPGAYIMWSLPHRLRQGAQSGSQSEPEFPLVPNRWLITRFKYPGSGENSGGNVTPPDVSAVIVQSDALKEIPSIPTDKSLYPIEGGVVQPNIIGKSYELADWEGEGAPSTPFLKAVGPGSLSWSVSYDDIKNVFSLYDDFGNDASDKAIYTYSIIGWYANPDDDVLSDLPVGADKEWRVALQSQFNWSLGKHDSDIQDAVDAWIQWQEDHGLKGKFDPSSINLPKQQKDAIIAWHAWVEANGVSGSQPDLPTKLLCHSMVANVVWDGDAKSYGTGVPTDVEFPAVAVGNTGIEAISSYMANRVAKELKEDRKFITEIERSLIGFQKDLLFDLANNEINKFESLLHNDEFEHTYGGQTWTVILPETEEENPQATGGQQTIPLKEDDTKTLTDLNALQDKNNVLYNVINSQRSELFLLTVKKGQQNSRSDQELVKKVNNSIDAIKSNLSDNIQKYSLQLGEIKKESIAFAAVLKAEKFVLKAIDLKQIAAPKDPVVMLAGGKLDSKLNSPGQYQENQDLFVRFTGQTVTGINITYNPSTGPKGPTETIGSAEILATGNIQMPIWNAIPKEAMDLWVEAMILDQNNAALLAKLYFKKAGITPDPSQLSELTIQIQTQQTAIWNDPEKLGVSPLTLADAVGVEGVVPSPESVSIRKGQPWTPIYLDWKVKWYPTSMEAKGAFDGWKFGDIDYFYDESSITNPSDIMIYQGRTTINTQIAQNIQGKFASFENDPNYKNLPEFIITNLQEIAKDIKLIDIVTQSMGGLGKQLGTEIIAMSNYPVDQDIANLLGDSGELFRPVVGSEKGPANPFFPVRSGHFQIIDLWMVDSFGQIWSGKNPNLGPEAPIPNVYWSESLTTPAGIAKAGTYGQLAPRLSQPSHVKFRFLQNDDDSIPSNSSDLTSPICGWVMPNHLDNSLMVFDAQGENQGSVIKIQRELTGEEKESDYSIRWDAAPGMYTQLGAPPKFENEHLTNFILGLLKTASKGSGAYDELLDSIDSTLWTISNFPSETGNLDILLGRPIAVVRADVSLDINGTPIYNQSWQNTGEYYDDKGVYSPTNPPYMDTPFSIRIGDSAVENNGVYGYFSNDNYDTFYSVHGIQGQTQGIKQILLKQSQKKAKLSDIRSSLVKPPNFISGYVEFNHLVSQTPAAASTKLTILADPVGNLPVITGSFPVVSLTLPSGPVSAALSHFKSAFRAGPLLLDPEKIKMPTPAEVSGKWSWVARKDVTTWNPDEEIKEFTPVATLSEKNPTLTEGWITLSGTKWNNKE